MTWVRDTSQSESAFKGQNGDGGSPGFMEGSEYFILFLHFFLYSSVMLVSRKNNGQEYDESNMRWWDETLYGCSHINTPFVMWQTGAISEKHCEKNVTIWSYWAYHTTLLSSSCWHPHHGSDTCDFWSAFSSRIDPGNESKSENYLQMITHNDLCVMHEHKSITHSTFSIGCSSSTDRSPFTVLASVNHNHDLHPWITYCYIK